MAAEAVQEISKSSIRDFLSRYVRTGQEVRTDALAALNATAEKHVHQKGLTPPTQVSEWLPLGHIVIGNLKTFLNGTFYGVSQRYLLEYINEFCYRFNRRIWEYELPMRLLNAYLAHVPIKTENC